LGYSGVTRANRIHAVALCDMCHRESYIRMVYCVPFGREHFCFCRECADGLLAPGARQALASADALAQKVPTSP